MFAGNINTKNAINKMPVIFMVDKTSNPIAASISIPPVARTICFFAGMAEGNIIAMPLVNLKCPIAVNASIKLMAALPLTLTSGCPMIYVAARHKRNVDKRTINGFITKTKFC